MTFQFAYENILSLKEKEKDLTLSEVGRLTIKKEGIQKELNSLRQNRLDCAAQWEQQNNVTFISHILQRNEYLGFLDKKIASFEKKLAEVDREIAVKKDELLSKQKEAKTWTSLREKSLNSYLEQQKKVEQDVLDEIASIRHFHQNAMI
ncbi:flagellar export protein FliJ [Neobacillus notoginsengisoli]|uniref:Flagellar FliJ protein n=1 Tax=Neobacillus notoginsengisoli TaxID=1578198 RepID=A0A417YJV8_9BACI|nr:flagellar export protein FliJ [Neobacillus notoginsengisoli]RHW33305.1 flagellar export protein FliJ [Neobacillus notoginsengisoli]